MQETLRGSPYTPQQFRHHVTLRKADTCGSHATARTLEIALAASRRGKTYTRRYGPVRALTHRVRYLVTGGAGFIGSHLVERLVQSGAEVTVLDDLSTGRRENLRNVRDRIRFIRGNAGRLAVCRRAAREGGVRRVVCAGSTAAYGDAAEVPNHEGLLPRPQSVYAAAKLAGEAYCQAFWHTHGLETVVLRYFNIFGPRQNLESQYGAVIPLFIAAALRGESPVMFGDGAQTRDFTFVSNVVDANLLACHAPAEQAAGGVFNIGCGMATSVRELWDMIADLVGVEIEPTEEPARAGDVRHSMASIERARELLGYNPTIDMATGLARTIDYFRGRVRAHDRLRIAV